MKQSLVRYLRGGAFIASSAAALAACGAESGSGEATALEPVADTGQPIIPGAAVSQVSRLYQLPANGSLTGVTADCPSGSVVVGGGYLAHPRTRVHRSQKAGNGWMVSIVNLSSTTSSTVNVVAECLSGTNATSTSYWAPPTTIEPGLTGCAQPKCPAGMVTTGGGYNGNVSFQAWDNIYHSLEWQVCGKNHNNFQPTSFSAHAVCLSGVTGAASRVMSDPVTVAPGQEARVDAACPQGMLLSMGGFRTYRTAYVRGSHRSFQDPTKWSETFLNQGTGDIVANVALTCLDIWR